MAVTELGNQIDKQFSMFTEVFIAFLHYQYLQCAQRYMNLDDLQKQEAFLFHAWVIKTTYEPRYEKSYQAYLNMSRLAETGSKEVIELANPKTLTYDDFVASTMINGPQSANKKAVMRGIPATKLPVLELQQSFNNVAAVMAQKTVEAPRDNAMEIIKKDKKAIGNARFPNSGACDFCMMLASKGPVFTSKKVGFAAHRACKCMGRAVYDGYVNSPLVQERTDKWLEDKKGKYTSSQNRKENKKQVDSGIRYKKVEEYTDKYGNKKERVSYPLTEKGKTMQEAERIAASDEYARINYKKADVPTKHKKLESVDEKLLRRKLEASRVVVKEQKFDKQDYRPGIFGNY
jgi:hypothetical protein